MEKPNWSNFTPFGGRLNGPDAFATWNTKMALDFLNVKDKPEDHGMTGEDHIRGVQVAHHTFVERLEAQNKSAPKYFALLISISPDKVLQRSAYFLERSKGQTILRDFLDRGVDKPRLTGFRGALIREAYRPEVLVDEPHKPEYGSCGETTPFISNLAQHYGSPKFTSLLEGFAMKVEQARKSLRPVIRG